MAAPPGAPTGFAAEPAAIAASVRSELLQVDRRWFDAFYAGDTKTITEINSATFRLADVRRVDQRPGPGSFPPVRRLDGVRVDVEGEALVLLARMTEQITSPISAVYVSDIVEIWLSTDGRWRLLGLRIRPADDARTP